MSPALLILFIRNSIPGKVKTRLAQTIGNDKALDVYIRMLEHIRIETGLLPSDKAVYYSDFIETDDIFDAASYDKFLQMGSDQGEKMYNAFSDGFSRGYKKVVIVCSDCFELSHTHILEAFEALNDVPVVLGPTDEGGYYLLGADRFLPLLFKNKDWGQENVFLDSLIDLKKYKLGFRILETLSDLETFDDLKRSGKFPDIAGNQQNS